MENALKFLRIQNFKSIKDVTLHPRRVNLIIGEPNVGKSNLLEAMTLLGSITYEPTDRFLGSFIRYEEPRQLFYDNLVGNTIKVETDRDVAVVVFNKKAREFNYLLCDADYYNGLYLRELHGIGDEHLAEEVELAMRYLPEPYEMVDTVVSKSLKKFAYIEFTINSITKSEEEESNDFISFELKVGNAPRPYTFYKRADIDEETGNQFLAPPHGTNLIEVIQTHPALRQEIAKMFERYGQKLQLRVDERKLEVIKDQDGMTYSYPYSSVADTLQRIIFYLAAIESNTDAVLLFEEPEAHSFPVYVSRLGRRIVESQSNQFFIDTHSPYLITEVLERMLPDEELAGELAIFAAYYDDHQTKIHQLSDAEIRSIREEGIDVFYNMKRFTSGAANA